MSEPTFGIHLFHGQRLLANLKTSRPVPEDNYEIDGVTYLVVEFKRVLESDGGEGFDIQVEPDSR